jgi:hypothetical protein
MGLPAGTSLGSKYKTCRTARPIMEKVIAGRALQLFHVSGVSFQPATLGRVKEGWHRQPLLPGFFIVVCFVIIVKPGTMISHVAFLALVKAGHCKNSCSNCCVYKECQIILFNFYLAPSLITVFLFLFNTKILLASTSEMQWTFLVY